ncbi:MAG TPA: hypothetical protein VMU16_03125 [Candidatus Binataceae bacterium]|nr:hypothetical protein [Candidatus Binataceae bacterium]
MKTIANTIARATRSLELLCRASKITPHIVVPAAASPVIGQHTAAAPGQLADYHGLLFTLIAIAFWVATMVVFNAYSKTRRRKNVRKILHMVRGPRVFRKIDTESLDRQVFPISAHEERVR